jgi:endoglucanase
MKLQSGSTLAGFYERVRLSLSRIVWRPIDKLGQQKSPGSLSQDKQGEMDHPSNRVFVPNKTDGKRESYMNFFNFWVKKMQAKKIITAALIGFFILEAVPSIGGLSVISIKVANAQVIKSVNVWWPTNGATVSGTQPFKIALDNFSVADYTAYWQVDGGQLNLMSNNYQDYPHKESSVNLSSWNWKGSGPYGITFVAKNNNGQEIARSTISIIIPNAIQVPPVVPAPSAPPVTSVKNVFTGAKLYVNPNSNAKKQANAWRNARPNDALLMDKVASGAETEWFGNWNGNVQNDVNNVVTQITNTGALPVLVAYDIPNRDCGGYSAGGSSPAAYAQWIRNFATGLHGRKAAVILEPDAVALTSCLSVSDMTTRYNLLRDAVSVLKAGGSSVYIDAGHSSWISAGDMAARLRQAGIDQADGFALNVSNFYSTTDNITYGQAVSSQLNGKHFIIDTGRNGSGPTSDSQWCNPSGRSLGAKPATVTGNPLVDAYLWIKVPGESDGQCNGGPSAGAFFSDYALGLAQRASW